MNDNNSSNFIICSKCGSEMKRTARYCMKCGNLNLEHPDNEFMRQYIDNNVKDSNAVLNDVSVGDRLKKCLIINLFIYGILVLISLIPMFISTNSFVVSIVGVISIVLLFIYNYSFQAIYIKAGKSWWTYYIPFYGNYVFFDIAMDSGWLFLGTFIPVIGFLLNFITFFKLGKKFGKSGLLTMLFPFIMIPILGLSRITFVQQSSFSINGLDTSVKMKKQYKRNKLFLLGIVLTLLGIIIYFIWPYIEILFNRFIV